jgi:large subunit ribosomal protein L32
MAVPRNRNSNARKNTRSAHMAKKPVSSVICKNCGSKTLSHKTCPSCGYYKGVQVVKKENDKKK